MPSINHPVCGVVHYTELSGGRLALDPSWERENIKTVFVPQLKGVPTYDGLKFSGKVPFYKRAIPQMLAAFRAVERAGLTHLLLFWGGSFVPRMKRGHNGPSNHSFGTAMDINPDENPFHHAPVPEGKRGSMVKVAAIFKRFGFAWGGDWIHGKDAMHLEAVRILSEKEIASAEGHITPSPAPKPAPPSVRRQIHFEGRALHALVGVDTQGTSVCRVRELFDEIGYVTNFNEQTGVISISKGDLR